MKKLKKLFSDFLKFQKVQYLKEINSWQIKELKLKREEIERGFEEVEHPTFLSFLRLLKTILYSKNPLRVCVKDAIEQWEIFNYLAFLKKQKLIEIKNGKILILEKEFLNYFPRPRNYFEIKRILEKKLKTKLKENLPSNFFFKARTKPHFDQLPVSVSSAIFAVEKILEYLPLYKKFLFVGDDDFLSVYLSLTEPKIESLVIDIDEEVLRKIKEFSEKFKLRIETRKIDIEKEKNLKEKFIGFWTNPPGNFEGTKTFLDFGLKNLGKDGGEIFLDVEDESIGHRILFLEKFFVQKNLEIKEVIAGKIYYPFSQEISEYRHFLKKMKKFFSEGLIKKSPVLGSSLWIFEYFPFKLKKLEKKSIYFYG